MRNMVCILFFSVAAFGQGNEINAGKLNGIVFADQQRAESVRAQIDKAAASCDTLSRICPVFIAPQMGAGEPSTLPPAATFVDFRKGFYLKGSHGFEEPVLGQGTISRIFTIKDYSNTNDNFLHSSALIELCGSTNEGTCSPANLRENNMLGLTVWASRAPGTIDAMGAADFLLRDESGTGASGKGEMRVLEADMGAPPGVTFNASGQNGDMSNTGILSDCVGRAPCGIGLVVWSNDTQGRGNWQRSALFRDWNSTGYGVHIVQSRTGSPYELVLDSDQPRSTETILFNDGGVGNQHWAISKTSNNDFVLYDVQSASNRLVAFHPVAKNAETHLNSVGASAIVMNMDAGSGSGGAVFGSGGPSPRPVASISSAGALQLGSVEFRSLGTATNGSMIYCFDCTVAAPASCTNVTTAAACRCASGGTGAVAKGINGAWLCQ
ncbi:MAG TPA: hypothetical protein VEG68_06590 [Terriglobales bacterium]|nr:hypothetical protein [Terriglobales bacterium]